VQFEPGVTVSPFEGAQRQSHRVSRLFIGAAVHEHQREDLLIGLSQGLDALEQLGKGSDWIGSVLGRVVPQPAA
jgi:hypothetical protein